MRRAFAALALLLAGTAAQAGVLPWLCERPVARSAAQQARQLHFAEALQQVLARSGAEAAIVSRAGTELGRFGIRYTHAGLAFAAHPLAPWSVRQLYYACDEGRPRLFDQGLAGFLMGVDDADRGFASVLLLPADAGAALQRAALDRAQALALLGGDYAANAYPFSVRYQNCNQWIAELFAAAWGGPGPWDRVAAQQWLAVQGYEPAAVSVGTGWMWLGLAVPFVHHADHPPQELQRAVYRTSVPLSLEAFAAARWPGAQRVELCHDAQRIVVRRDGPRFGARCEADAQDEVIEFGAGGNSAAVRPAAP